MKRLILALLLITPTAQAIDYTADDVMRLADVMYCEARGEGRLGMLAVGDVVKNRVNDSRWPNTVRGVIEQPRQFSCIGDVVRIDDDAAYELAVDLAAYSLSGKAPRITRANHYYAHGKISTPAWARQMSQLGEIGNHRFYLN